MTAATKELKAAISVAVDKNTPPTVSKAEANQIATAAQAEIAKDPALVNALGQERWWQSGVGFFGAGGVLWSVGAILTQVADHGTNVSDYEMDVMVTALGALGSFIAVLYRRYWPGLKPLFWRWG